MKNSRGLFIVLHRHSLRP